MDGNELKYVTNAFETNWIAPLGPLVDRFEYKLSEFFLNNQVHLVNSGTSAIHLAIKALGITKGDIVLCQSFTFAGTVFPVLYENAIPVFIDSDTDNINLSPNILEDAIKYFIRIGKKPKLIIPVHLYGFPAKMNEIEYLGLKYEIPILEDAAEAIGSLYFGKKCGTLGNVSIVSFNGNKLITTSGGGAIIANDPSIIKKAKYLSNSAKEDLPYYSHGAIGYNYRLSNVLAGIGLGQLENIVFKIERKRYIHNLYKKAFADCNDVVLLEENKNTLSNYWLNTLLFSDKILAKITPLEIKGILEQANIESRLFWNPLHLQTFFEPYQFFGSDKSENLFKRGLCLPSSTSLSDEDIWFISSKIKKIIYEKI